jgi:NifU-like protein involved in Fe-S cluster formation
VIAVMTSAMTAEMIGMMIDVARTITTARTTTTRSDLHQHHLKGATLMVRFNPPIERSSSSSVAAK